MNSLLLVYIIIAVVAVCTNGYINNNIRLGITSNIIHYIHYLCNIHDI